jgi:metal-responsive CopG/Arc/MetJ family transcriptional regulator
MATKPVQLSIDEDLLAQIDSDPDARQLGRSAFIRRAVRMYLRAKQRRQIDNAIEAAYGEAADEMLDEVEALLDAQVWPDA